jgi:3-deoxy-D-manno-octulosonic-acid transferase
MQFLYNIVIYFYTAGIYLASVFNSKAKKWVDGRSNWKENLKEKINNTNYYWVHCASLGEFEQGRPLIERLKKEYPKIKIILTFFSPSGYEIRKNYAYADIVCYLPADTKSNVKTFLDIVKPSAAFFIKYEFWFNYLIEIKKRNINCYLIAGIFRNNQIFFTFYGSWFKKQLGSFTFFFLQNEISCNILKQNGFTNFTNAGDTRFDRCLENAATVKEISLINIFKEHHKLLIAGSTWPAEEKIIASLFKKNSNKIKCIIAPHEIHEAHLHFIETLFPFKVLRYSKATINNIKNAQILLIDNIGMLSSLYQYADLAVIGGAFHGRLHNCLEAAVFGVPVLLGPKHQKNYEATELIEKQAAYSFSNITQFTEIVNTLIQQPSIMLKAKENAKNYIKENEGTTKKILLRLNIKYV